MQILSNIMTPIDAYVNITENNDILIFVCVFNAYNVPKEEATIDTCMFIA